MKCCLLLNRNKKQSKFPPIKWITNAWYLHRVEYCTVFKESALGTTYPLSINLKRQNDVVDI